MNDYSANNLSVQKIVTGNMGDRQKDFEVDVTFTVPVTEDAPMASKITYNNGEELTINTTDWTPDADSDPATQSVTKSVKLKHDGTVIFQNLPVGVSYTVKEKDVYATTDGYDPAKYSVNVAAEQATENAAGASSRMDIDGEKVIVVNNKGINVDTGVLLDSLPYILLLVFVGAGLIVFFVKKRTSREN